MDGQTSLSASQARQALEHARNEIGDQWHELSPESRRTTVEQTFTRIRKKTRDEQQSQEKDQSMKYPNPVGDTPAGFFQVTGSAGFENPFFTNDSKEGDEADTNDEGAPSFFRQFRPESLRAPLHQQSVWQGEWIREAHQYYQPGDEIASAQIHAIQALQRAKEHDSETRIADEAMLHASKG